MIARLERTDTRVETNMTRRPPSSAGLLLDSGPQMTCFSANESALTLTKYVKIREHEQGR